ncbi:MAG: tRNA epoxyqueuosine(34) reductase QueG [Pirellulales bacterium]|nr:tRNA epoxyqueuosine(34) reductase QueG [Pirellulales bacterium]
MSNTNFANSQPLTPAEQIKTAAAELGFSVVGICPAAQPPGLSHLDRWIAAGFAGEMGYFASRREAYADPAAVLDGVRSLIVLAMPYRTSEPPAEVEGRGRVARYAWGNDYHDVIRERLAALGDSLQTLVPGARVRGVVDTAPLLERDFAQVAGLGWAGKNTLLLNRQQGSYFFLAVLLTDAELAYDQPFERDHCGTCRACLDACPTQAFIEPHVLDASRCVSYLTIEHRTAIPAELRAGVGDWLFGCDVCQDVCPWNRKAPTTTLAEFWPRDDRAAIELTALFELDDAEFRKRFRGTPLARPKRRGLLRNAAIVLGNQRNRAAVPTLIRALDDDEPLVRGAAAWALGQMGGPKAVAALTARLRAELDAEVAAEINAALLSAG